MKTLSDLIKQLKEEEERAAKAYMIDAVYAFEIAIDLAEQLLEYQIQQNYYNR